MARDAIGAFREMTGRARRFARRVLKTWRENIEDVQRGALFNQMLEQHGVDAEDFGSNPDEQGVESAQNDWMNDLRGGDYASQVPYAPVYEPEYVPLSQHGVWDHGESSQQAESSRAAEERAQTTQQTAPQRVTRYGRQVQQPDAYTPDVGGRGPGGRGARGRRRGRDD